jgi:hypothetical protein
MSEKTTAEFLEEYVRDHTFVVRGYVELKPLELPPPDHSMLGCPEGFREETDDEMRARIEREMAARR